MAERVRVTGGIDELLELIEWERWGDGLVVVAPTPARVAGMLEGSERV